MAFFQLPSEIQVLILDYVTWPSSNKFCIFDRYSSNFIEDVFSANDNIKNLILTNKNMKNIIDDYINYKRLFKFIHGDRIAEKIYKNPKEILRNIEVAYFSLLFLSAAIIENSPEYAIKFRIFGGFIRDLFYQKKIFKTDTPNETMIEIIRERTLFEMNDIDICVENIDIRILKDEIEKIDNFFAKIAESKKGIWEKIRLEIIETGASWNASYKNYFCKAEIIINKDNVMKIDIVSNPSNTKDFTCNLLSTSLNLDNFIFENFEKYPSIDENRIINAIYEKKIEPIFLILGKEMDRKNIIGLIKRIKKRWIKGWEMLEDDYLKFVGYIRHKFFSNFESIENECYQIEKYKKYINECCMRCGLYIGRFDLYFSQINIPGTFGLIHSYTHRYSHYLCLIEKKL